MPDVLAMLPPVEAEEPMLPPSRVVVGARVDATNYAEATDIVLAWARAGRSRVVCATGAHGVIEAQSSPAFSAALDAADLNVPDGMPLVWALRAAGLRRAERVYGPDLMLAICRAAAREGLPVALYGSAPDVLAALDERLPALAPGLDIAAAISPPFRALTAAEMDAYAAELTASGARIVFVGLGCPRQEQWAAAMRGRIPAVLVTVGAAFDFHAGRLRQAPPRMQRMGLEWLFRLYVEPRRLWRRYARIVPRFLAGYARLLLRMPSRRVA